jgi:hypothetical protein
VGYTTEMSLFRQALLQLLQLQPLAPDIGWAFHPAILYTTYIAGCSCNCQAAKLPAADQILGPAAVASPVLATMAAASAAPVGAALGAAAAAAVIRVRPPAFALLPQVLLPPTCCQQRLHHILVPLVDGYVERGAVVLLTGDIDVRAIACMCGCVWGGRDSREAGCKVIHVRVWVWMRVCEGEGGTAGCKETSCVTSSMLRPPGMLQPPAAHCRGPRAEDWLTSAEHCLLPGTPCDSSGCC